MLIITGNGRSGTTVIASFLHRLNFINAGNDWMHGTKRGGAEAGWVNNIIKSFNSGEELDGDTKDLLIKCDVIKSPQFMNSGNEILWNKFKLFDANLKVLICYRNFKDAANSFRKYNMSEFGRGYTTYTDEEDLLEIRLKDYYFNCIEFLNKFHVEYEVLTFPDYLFDYSKTVMTLNKLGFNFDVERGKTIWDQLVDTTAYV